MVWGTVISAGSNLIGGYLQNRSNERINSQNLGFSYEQLAQQREFAQQGIRWRVEDAQKAGIHPLYAMGASIPTYSPVSAPLNSNNAADYGLSAAGQDIGRAITATQTKKERESSTIHKLSVERAGLENDLLRAQIAKEKAQIGPPLPSANTDWLTGSNPDFPIPPVQRKPLEATRSDANDYWSEGGSITDVGWIRTPTGLVPVPSGDAKDRIEELFLPSVGWQIRNNLIPNVNSDWATKPPRNALPHGATDWYWSHKGQEWRPSFKPGRSMMLDLKPPKRR